MKTFLKKIFVYVIVVALIVGFLNFTYVKNRSDSDYINTFSEIPNEIQICNFGSSHGLCSYNYEDLREEYNCFNFGLVSQTLSYDNRFFQNYEKHIEKGTVVFITISYFSLFGKNEVEKDDFISKNKRYYNILPPKLIKEYDIQSDIFIRYLPVLGVDYKNLVGTLLRKSTNDNEEREQKKASDIDVVADAKKAFERHIKKDKLNDEGHRIQNQEEIDALYDLIERCNDKGAIPILITTPYLSEYTDEVKTEDSFYNDFYSLINEVISDTGVEYYDYAFDSRFTSNYKWFMNSDHLNKEGARNFVNILMEEVVYKNGYY